MADYELRRFSRIEYEELIALGVFQPGEALVDASSEDAVRTRLARDPWTSANCSRSCR